MAKVGIASVVCVAQRLLYFCLFPYDHTVFKLDNHFIEGTGRECVLSQTIGGYRLVRGAFRNVLL